ncbi:MAG TPA: S53 family peptidase [Anaeromyxobacteraceae bacterium]|jgi:subtilase family serine protease|nr:S53 family peptidase [Anaeromyxobacteraceae bacterium]
MSITHRSAARPLPLFALAAALLAGATAADAQGRVNGEVTGPGTVALRGGVHPLAQPRFDRGRAAGTAHLSGVTMVLAPSAAQQADLEKLLAAQQDPASSSYHRWLTPEEYADRFGPTADEVAAVTAWLEAQGFAVDGISRSRARIFFSGSVARLEAAFRTEIHRYSVDGESHFANATEPSVPAALAGMVLGVRHLDDFRMKPRASLARHPLAPRFTSSITGNHFLAPDDFATIYGLQPLYAAGLTGAGVTIAVVGQTQIDPKDVAAFRAASGLSANAPQVLLVPGSGVSTSVAADVDEAALDIEWSGGVARDAHVLYVYTGNNPSYGALDSLQYAVDQRLAPVISVSYGDCEAHFSATEAQTLRQLLQQANAQGQTVTTASGDFGAADCETGSPTAATTGLAVDLPSSAPEATSVGGTAFTADVSSPAAYWGATNDPLSGSALAYIPEGAWNDTTASGTLAAGGGGVSTLFPKPSWQTGAGVPADGHRDVPDLALTASPDHDAYLVCSQGSCVQGYRDSSNGLTVVGGTSAGAPAFAGILAILNQAKGGSGLGNVNPTLYALAASTPAAFHDVTSGNNVVPCTATTTGCPTGAPYQYGYQAGAGYDLVTGLGSPDAGRLVAAWPGASTAVSDFALAASAASLTMAAGGGGQVTLTVTPEPANGFGQAVTFSCGGLPAGASCAFSPPRVTPGGAPVTTLLTVQTTSATALLQRPFHRDRRTFYALLLPGALGVAGARRRRWAAAAVIALVALLCACGSGGSSAPRVATPVGTSTVTVTATSAGTPSISHQVVVGLTVQ